MNAQLEEVLDVSNDHSLEQALEQLHLSNQELEKFIDQLLGEISRLVREVETNAEQLILLRQQLDKSSRRAAELADENSRLTIQVQQRSDALTQAHSEIERLRSEAKSTRHSTSDDDAARQDEVERLRRELASAKLELLKRDSSQSNDSSQQANELTRRNEALESELSQARGHAVQLTETIDRQRQELNQQRETWNQELQAMRLQIQRGESPGQSPSFSETSVVGETATVTRDDLEIRANSNNSVVDSVMAQFAKLQRDVNRRRTQRQA